MTIIPDYPLPPGGHMPDLNLAEFNVASGASIQVMPTLTIPTLTGSPDMGGIDPANIIPNLNLAGRNGFPPTGMLGQPAPMIPIHLPDFGIPDFGVPMLSPGDIAGAGIDQRPEWSADPDVPDLTEYHHPYGLDIHDNTIQAVDPSVADLTQYDTPTGLTINRDPWMPDPLVPDLQHPDLQPRLNMSTRPGDLDDSALQVMDPMTASQVQSKDYPDVWMDATGVNSTRDRHMTLMMRGLHDDL